MRLKEYRGTLILLLLLAVLGAFVYYYEARGSADAEGPEKEAQIFTLNEGDIKTVNLRDGEKTVALALDDAGTWQVVGPPSQPADEWAVTTLLWRLANLSADRVVADTVEDPASFGLDKPQIELRLGLADGKEETLYVGNENPRGTGSYARKAGAETLYLINASLVSDLRKLSAQPAQATPTPQSALTPTATP